MHLMQEEAVALIRRHTEAQGHVQKSIELDRARVDMQVNAYSVFNFKLIF